MGRKEKKLTSLAKSGKKDETTNGDGITVDENAKKRANELIEQINLSTTPNNDMLELDDDNTTVTVSTENSGNLEWLQEQVSKLSEVNEKLREDAATAKEDYKRLFESYNQLKNGGGSRGPELIPDSELKNNVTSLFIEFQNNFLGKNDERKRYSQIQLLHLIRKMLNSFPFLEQYKRV